MRWNKIALILFLSFGVTLGVQAQIRMIVKKLHGAGSTTGYTEQEAAAGIREALQVGIDTAVKLVTRPDGFFGNAAIRIPFPEEVRSVESKLRSLGMGSLVDEVILTMNRAAEDAAGRATPIFTAAIKNMTLSDAIAIVKGPENAATQYLSKTSTPALTEAFKPVVQQSLDKVNATQAWQVAINAYNQIPFVTKQNADLAGYVTEKAIEGLFVMVAREEKKIRQNPLDRTTELLQKIFGQ
jgi:hypothetical protein